MQKASQPALARLLQDAVDQGQIVLIPAPGQLPVPPPTPPLHTRSEVSLAALCLIFRLKHSEGQMLARLLTHDCCSIEEIRNAATHAGRTVTAGTARSFLSTLRKKLADHDIRINTIPTMGYGLDGASRGRIQRLLAEHDAGLMSSPEEPIRLEDKETKITA